MTTFLLLVLIIVVAAAGGFLGELLELAGWIVLTLAVLGAVAGFLIWRSVRRFLDRA
jgi:energy-converting hydrogenase Eha subunit G